MSREVAVEQIVQITPEMVEEIILPPARSEKAARLISDVLSPPVVAGLSLIVVAFFAGTMIVWESIGIFLIIAIGLPTLYVFWLVNRKLITDFHIPIRRQRIKPMLVMLASAFISLGLLVIIHPPRFVILLSITAVTQLVLIFLITLKWKISGHAATISTFSILCWVLFGPIAGFVFILIPVVIWARLRLRRHTPLQTIAGTVLGLLSLVGLLMVI